MRCSKLCSKIIVVPAAKLLIGSVLFLGKRPGPPVMAAEVASQPRPCWVAYPSDARVVSLPDRTPWQPRYKAGRGGAESLDSRRPALSGRTKVSQLPLSERAAGGRDLAGSRTAAPGHDDHGFLWPGLPDEFRFTTVVLLGGWCPSGLGSLLP